MDAAVVQVDAELGGVGLEIVALDLAFDVPALLAALDVDLLDAAVGNEILGPVADVLGDVV